MYLKNLFADYIDKNVKIPIMKLNIANLVYIQKQFKYINLSILKKLLHIIIKNEIHLTLNDNSSKKLILPFTSQSDKLIDDYITQCQNENYSDDKLSKNFNTLILKCLNIEAKQELKDITIKHDIDVLFSTNSDKYYYLEVKYNDDHDTGKYADINRKFIKSYIGICNILKIYDIDKFKPILYYLTKKRLKGNIYLPENEIIYRGDKLFDEFFTINYNDLDNFMENIGDDKEIVGLFDKLYKNIRYDLKLN
jgi:hypothetical protein